MKNKDELKPNNAPVYAAAMYPDLASVCQSHGYALAVHGSLARDFDVSVGFGECFLDFSFMPRLPSPAEDLAT